MTPVGTPPTGYGDPSNPGFRYDLATDTAVALPLLVASPLPTPVFGNLDTYPYFAYHEPGARLFPATMFGPAIAVAGSLRTHCRFEAALKWYALVFDPLRRDCAWAAECDREDGSSDPGPIELAEIANTIVDSVRDILDSLSSDQRQYVKAASEIGKRPDEARDAREAFINRLGWDDDKLLQIRNELTPLESSLNDEVASRAEALATRLDRDEDEVRQDLYWWIDTRMSQELEGPDDEVPTPDRQGRDDRCCDISAPSDEKARDRSVTLHYLETLQQWGDALMCRNSPEAFQQARLIFDTQARILGDRPRSVLWEPDPKVQEEQKVDGFKPECPPLNPRLLALYDLVDDRRALIHACLNERRLRNGHPNVDMPYWGDSPVRAGWRSVADTCADEEDWCACCHPPYRFSFLIQKALEIAGDVRGLGTALLAAFEKCDAEYLASLRASHERQLLDLALEVRENQWRVADWQIQGLQKTKEGAQERRRYYDTLVRNDLIGGERQYRDLTILAMGFQAVGRASEFLASGTGLSPDFYVGFPVSLTHIPAGSKLASTFSSAARVSDFLASIANTTASLRLTEGGWDRREAEWLHQIEVIDIEIEQIERQILAAEQQRDAALRELNNHQRQMEHAAEVHDFLRDRFTNAELCLWLQQETSALYYQMFELARHTARQAQRAFNVERGYTARTFLPAEAWDDLHEGLLAGERLHLSLRQMERAYLCENMREYELTKHISLRLHFPLEFLRLKATGRCEIEIPEWMFDCDYPGQYLRRIKNVTLTLPTVVGPYTGVHCRLTLLSSVTRVQPYLIDPPSGCCDDSEPQNGYETVPGDLRMVRRYAATEAIATSSGQNDSGMFQLRACANRRVAYVSKSDGRVPRALLRGTRTTTLGERKA